MHPLRGSIFPTALEALAAREIEIEDASPTKDHKRWGVGRGGERGGWNTAGGATLVVWRNARCVLPPPLQLLRQRKLQGCRQQEGEKQYTLHRQAAGGRTEKPLQQPSQKPQT
ncbi:unnamed protein product [Sphagnum jensenii]|uniref:Uncharacterized protein n=1 Tax=Sphagnum jensenii TaxID=128206 RepID=A0ABP0W3P0_9BRYO